MVWRNDSDNKILACVGKGRLGIVQREQEALASSPEKGVGKPGVQLIGNGHLYWLFFVKLTQTYLGGGNLN